MRRTPTTPFATSLSGSAKETELRIRSILQWKKGRPPLWLMVLALAALVACFGLVSCQPTQRAQVDLSLDFYDELGNYAQVPTLVGTLTPTLEGVNGELAQLSQTYSEKIAALEGADLSQPRELFRILSHHTAGEEYLSILLYEDTSAPHSAALRSWVYQWQEDRLLTFEDALSLAGTDMDHLETLFTPPQAILDPPDRFLTPEAFHVDGEGMVTLYLRAAFTDIEGTPFQLLYYYNDTTGDDLIPVPGPDYPDEHTLTLWTAWRERENPHRYNFQGQSQYEVQLLSLLAQDRDGTWGRTLLTASQYHNRTFGAAAFTNGQQTDLVIGAMDNRTGTLIGQPFQCSKPQGTARAVTMVLDQKPHILYTNIAAPVRELPWGEAGRVTLEDDQLTWAWPVTGTLGASNTQPMADYNAFWRDHLAFLFPTGFELFQIDPDHPDYRYYDIVQWAPDNVRPLQRAAVISALRSALPWEDTLNWRFLSLDTISSEEHNGNWTWTYALEAERAWGDPQRATATFVLSDDMAVQQLLDWYVEPAYDGPWEELNSPLNLSLRDQLILDYFKESSPNSTCYLAGFEPEHPAEGEATRIDSIHFLGEDYTYESTGAAYLVTRSSYYNHRTSADDPGTLGWHPMDPVTVVLGRSGYEGTLDSVTGSTLYRPERETAEVIQEITYNLLHYQTSLYRDGWAHPAGLGGQVQFFRPSLDGEEQITLVEQVGPDAYYADHSWEGFTARCYHPDPAEKPPYQYAIQSVKTTRTDLYTPRGIRVGSTRAEALAAYPTALTGDYWGLYPEGTDLLVYLPNSTHDPTQVTNLAQLDFYARLGPALILLFDGDTVRELHLYNQYN